jgi:nucleoside-diphosphate-sugar epimerase
VDDRTQAKEIGPRDLFGYSTIDGVARACLLGLTSERFKGHEVFYIIGSDIVYDHLEEDEKRWARFDLHGNNRTSVGLLGKTYSGTKMRQGWWDEGRDLRGFFDCSKAEALLDWRHET